MRGTGPSTHHLRRGRALVLLDLTHDRLEPHGAFPVPAFAQARRFLDGELHYFRERGRPVIHVATRFDLDEPMHMEGLPNYNRRGSHGAEFHELFAPEPGEVIIEKPYDSAFAHTELVEILSGLDVGQISIAGVETQSGVLATAIDGHRHGYRVVVPDTCIASTQPTLHRAALTLLQETRWLCRSAEAPGPRDNR